MTIQEYNRIKTNGGTPLLHGRQNPTLRRFPNTITPMAPIKFGALVYDYQAIDVVGPFDLLSNCSKASLGYVKKHVVVDDVTFDKAPEFEFHHIGDNPDAIPLLSSAYRIQRTVAIEGCSELGCLLIGGPMPEGFAFPDSYVDFIRRHVAAGKTLFTTCTGAYALATTGVLDGKRATANNLEYNQIAAEFPKVQWTRETNFGLEVLIAGAMGLDYEPRDIDGRYTVFPQRCGESGKQISTTVFPCHA
ncbi:hypothetical protein LTR53_006638 [Teratosphaeriaceae sp. CCFEE 6253]|nr:hypothetical protein LTR53_006638 [Teratosphaeriaceae sp. CCFEE 6253]